MPIARLHLHESLMQALREFQVGKNERELDPVSLTSIINLDLYNYSVQLRGPFMQELDALAVRLIYWRVFLG